MSKFIRMQIIGEIYRIQAANQIITFFAYMALIARLAKTDKPGFDPRYCNSRLKRTKGLRFVGISAD